jgi:hypothetical protein
VNGPAPHTTDDWFRTRRRRLVSAALGGTTGGLAGCSAAESDPTATREQHEPTAHDHANDHLGESDPVDRIDVARISGSRREGDVVYYDPDDRGPYSDGQAAFDDVPPAGTFVLGHGIYDVATEGRLVREDPINIRGVGWRVRSGEPLRYYGSVFANAGEDVVDEPVIDCSTDDRARQSTFHNFAVVHEGPTSPGIRIRNFIFNTITDCGVECQRNGAKGISFEEGGYFTRMHRTQVSHATDICVHVSGKGYAHEFYSNHVRTHVEDARACLQTEQQRTIVVGGEYATRTEGGPPAIRFYNPESGAIAGGLVMEPGLEVNARIEIDGESEFNDVQLYHLKLPRYKNLGDTPVVTFGRTRNSKLVYPLLWSNQAHVARFSEHSRNCGVITDVDTLTYLDYTNEGATKPYISANGTATRDQLRAMPTGVPTTVEYLHPEAAPATHDGSEWQVAEMQSVDGV